MTDSVIRKMVIYFGVFCIGFLGMLVMDGLNAHYRNYLLFEALAIGGTLGYVITPAWAQLKYEATQS